MAGKGREHIAQSGLSRSDDGIRQPFTFQEPHHVTPVNL